MRRISFGNDDTHISTIAFEVRCHPDNASIFKTLLSRITTNDKTPSSKETVQIIPYGLIQYSSPDYHEQQLPPQSCNHHYFQHRLRNYVL